MTGRAISEDTIFAVTIVAIGLVVVGLNDAGQTNPSTPFPFGTGAAPGCYSTGSLTFDNQEYWWCSAALDWSPANVTRTGNSSEIAAVTFADVEFRAQGGSAGNCQVMTVLGQPLNSMSSSVQLRGATPGCAGVYGQPPSALARGGGWGVIWIYQNWAEFLVRSY